MIPRLTTTVYHTPAPPRLITRSLAAKNDEREGRWFESQAGVTEDRVPHQSNKISPPLWISSGRTGVQHSQEVRGLRVEERKKEVRLETPAGGAKCSGELGERLSLHPLDVRK